MLSPRPVWMAARVCRRGTDNCCALVRALWLALIVGSHYDQIFNGAHIFWHQMASEPGIYDGHCTSPQQNDGFTGHATDVTLPMMRVGWTESLLLHRWVQEGHRNLSHIPSADHRHRDSSSVKQ
eukprot:scaffold371411_cov17-Prasinocladus_malaysianus.AAC.1